MYVMFFTELMAWNFMRAWNGLCRELY